jgi:hypothetical protein
MMRGPLDLTSAALAFAVLAVGCSGKPKEQPLVVRVPSGSDAGDQGADAAGGFGLGQVDRAARPLVAVLLIPPSLENDYNAVSTFDTPLPRTLSDAISSHLQALDTIALGDGGPDPVDWPVDAGAHPLAGMLDQDMLLVDIALPCTSPDGGFVASYLDIEREIFLSQAGHTTCGGRTPNEDVVDSMLRLLVTADRDGGPQVTQGIAGPSKPAMTRFPYLAGP